MQLGKYRSTAISLAVIFAVLVFILRGGGPAIFTLLRFLFPVILLLLGAQLVRRWWRGELHEAAGREKDPITMKRLCSRCGSYIKTRHSCLDPHCPVKLVR